MTDHLAGMYLLGLGATTIDIGKTGTVSGQIGLKMEASIGDPQITFDVENDGKISGRDAIVAMGMSFDFVNGKHGEIIGISTGISVDAVSLTIVNHGTIAAAKSGVAIAARALVSTSIVNDGLIVGKVLLGDGQSIFDTRGGTVRGTVEEGDGAGTLIVSNAKVKMVENPDGTDTIRSTVTYSLGDNIELLILFGKAAVNGTGNGLVNELRGNSSANKLYGLGGEDALYGGKGKVMDFVEGTDMINLKDWSVFNNFDDLMKTYAVDKGDDLLISYKGDSLLIVGVQKADLTSADIIV